MIFILLQCQSCRHYHPDGLTCDAFPEAIPDEVLEMDVDHREPYPGDQGIHWEPREPGVIHPLEEDQEG